MWSFPLTKTTFMEKKNRKLSGIFLRYQGNNWCFEDLPIEEQNRFMDKLDIKALKNLSLRLADTINEVAEEYNIPEDKTVQ
jgi:hypothetical protein